MLWESKKEMFGMIFESVLFEGRRNREGSNEWRAHQVPIAFCWDKTESLVANPLLFRIFLLERDLQISYFALTPLAWHLFMFIALSLSILLLSSILFFIYFIYFFVCFVSIFFLFCFVVLHCRSVTDTFRFCCFSFPLRHLASRLAAVRMASIDVSVPPPPAGHVVHLPPLVDCHVHFREPGLTAKGDMQSEGTAALAGGIQVACDMPNTSPPTQSIAALQDKVNLAAAKCPIRMFFFFGATSAAHLDELEALWTKPEHTDLKRHCCGLKLYLDNSTGNLKSSAEVTRAAFALCGRLDIPLVAHCEHAGINEEAGKSVPYTGPETHSLRRPAKGEHASICEAIEMAREFRTPLHIAHLSTREGLDAVRTARREDPSLRLTCEVTPHHLFLTTVDYGCCGSRVKVNPPIREVQHAEHLWHGLLAGDVDCVGTDHAPHTLREKEQPRAAGEQPPSGMPGIEVVVPMLLTVLIAGRWPHPSAPIPAALQQDPKKLSMDLLVRVMHENPNRIFRLGLSDAPDPSIGFDVGLEWTCGWSPYHNWKLVGKRV
eukprot:gene7015-4975_t